MTSGVATVTLNYNWTPEVYLSPITLKQHLGRADPLLIGRTRGPRDRGRSCERDPRSAAARGRRRGDGHLPGPADRRAGLRARRRHADRASGGGPRRSPTPRRTPRRARSTPTTRPNAGLDPQGKAAAAGPDDRLGQRLRQRRDQHRRDGEHPADLGPDSIGLAGYAEVIVTYNQPAVFSAIWGSGVLPVTARAVARGLLAPSRRRLGDPARPVRAPGPSRSPASGHHPRRRVQVNSSNVGRRQRQRTPATPRRRRSASTGNYTTSSPAATSAGRCSPARRRSPTPCLSYAAPTTLGADDPAIPALRDATP